VLITPHIFLDTTVFDQNSHNYSSTAFQRLASLVNENRIKLYITDITQREIESHIRTHVEAAQDNIRAALNGHRFLKSVRHPSIDAVSNGIAVGEVIDALLGQFRGWLSEMSVTVLPTEHVSVKEIFDKYFDGSPPFEAKRKKKAEFPDAFALAAAEGWCQEHSAKMYVISNDGGMSAACESSRLLESIKSLPEFLDILTQGERWAELANKLFETHEREVWQKIKLAVDHLGMMSSYQPHVEVEYAHVTSVKLLKHYLLEVEEAKAVFEVNAIAYYTASVSRHNYAIGMMMGVPGFRTQEYKRGSKRIHAEVTLSFDATEQGTCVVESAIIKYPDYYLDDDAWLE
jgi:hypothetical protein